jgi:YesN/AraC family two-component response regulator
LDLKIKLSYKTTDSIKLALDWLEQHFMEEFQLEKLANEVHLSPSYLSNIFHKEIGSSISDYLAVRRIQEACMLLKTTSLSVLDIGQRVGLNNASYFCKFFKKYVGMTPYNFKKLNGNL